MNWKKIISPAAIVLLLLYTFPGVEASEVSLQTQTGEDTVSIAQEEAPAEEEIPADEALIPEEAPAEEETPGDEALIPEEAPAEDEKPADEVLIPEEAPAEEETPTDEVLTPEEATAEDETPADEALIPEDPPAEEETPGLLPNPQLEELGLASPQLLDENGSIPIPDDGTLLDIRIPEKIGGVTLFDIAPAAFDGTTCLRSVTIPAAITQIGAEAFANCSGLEYIILEDRANLEDLILGENWNGNATVVFGQVQEETPADETTEPSEEATEPSEETTEPSEEGIEPAEETTEPSEEGIEPAEETTKPSEEVTEPAAETTVLVASRSGTGGEITK